MSTGNWLRTRRKQVITHASIIVGFVLFTILVAEPLFETMIRESVTGQFKELGLNLDYSGFSAPIPTREIASGEYSVGIYITKDHIEALIYTNKAIIKSGDTIETK